MVQLSKLLWNEEILRQDDDKLTINDKLVVVLWGIKMSNYEGLG